MKIETGTPVYRAGEASARGITGGPIASPGGTYWRVLWHDGTETQEHESALMIDETNAVAWAPFAAKSTLEDIAALQAVATESAGYAGNGLIRERLESLGVEVDNGGLVDADSAIERLYEYPLTVEATTTFEVVLGAGGPDSRILVECDRVEMNSAYEDQVGTRWAYEIRRVLFRYSWEGAGEVELTGDDKETAEAFARRVVPELAE